MENQRDLQPPPRQTLRSNEDLMAHQKEALVDCHHTLRFFNEEWTRLEKALRLEQALLARLVKRKRDIFRNDKGFVDLQHVMKTLSRLWEVTLPHVTSELRMDFPLVVDLVSSDRPYLPAKQTLEHALLRLYGAAGLLKRLMTMCGLAAAKQDARLRLGHHWNAALCHTAAVARIWTVTKMMFALVNGAYTRLLPSLACLPASKCQFLSPEQQMPTSLMSLLPKGSIYEEVEKIELSFPPPHSLKKVNSSALGNGIIIEHPTVKSDRKKKRKIASAPTDDVQALPSDAQELPDDAVPAKKLKRNGTKGDADESKPSTKVLRQLKQALLWFSRWSTLTDVTEFAAMETAARKQDRTRAVTRPLGQSQWRAMRHWLKNCVKEGELDVSALKERAAAWTAFPELKGDFPTNWKQLKKRAKSGE